MMTVCDNCGDSYRYIGRHRKTCLKVPLPDELARILEDETGFSLGDFCERYGCSYPTLYSRLEGTQWTKARLAERATGIRHIRLAEAALKHKKHLRCSRCDLLVTPGVKLCTWCDLADAGIKDYRGLLDVDAVIYVAEVV